MQNADAVRTDVLVIGAGPAGIAAAVTAAEAGARVMIVDAGARVGGQVWRHRSTADLPAHARRWVARLDASAVEQCLATTVVDVQVPAVASARFTVKCAASAGDLTVHADALVLTAGARELFLPFPGWTLPGVVGAGAIQALLKGGLDVRGRRAVVSGSGPLLLVAAAALRKGGADVLCVLEQARAAHVRAFASSLLFDPARLLAAAGYRLALGAVRYRSDAWVTDVRGAGCVEDVGYITPAGPQRVDCDLLCTGFGLVPSTELARVAGCAIESGAVIVDETQTTSVAGISAAGEITGVAGEKSAVAQGVVAGHSAASSSGSAATARQRHNVRRVVRRESVFAARLARAFELRAELRALATADTLVCRCEDVSMGAIDACMDMRHAKLVTRAGMGPCQGRVCGAALQFLCGWSADTVRPPVFPVNAGSLVNQEMDP